MADENLSVKVEADIGDYVRNMSAAGRSASAFGVAGTKAGKAAASAAKEVTAAAREAAKAEADLARAAKDAAKQQENAANLAARLAEAHTRQRSAATNVALAEERLNKLRAQGRADAIAKAEASLENKRAKLSQTTRMVAGIEATQAANRTALATASARQSVAETALAAATARTTAAQTAAAAAAAKLSTARAGGLAMMARDMKTLALSSEDVRSSFTNVAAVAGGALAAGLGYSIYAAVQLEQRLRNVSTIAPEVGDHIGEFADRLLEMSKTVPQSVNQLAEGLYDVVSSGFAAEDAMRILQVSSVAASAGLTDTATSARAITSVLNAYGLSAMNASEVSDVLFATVNAGIVTFEQAANQIGDFIGLAAASGAEFSDVMGGFAAITRAGINSAQAATGIQNVLRALVRPSENLQAALKDIGMESGAASIEALGFKGTIEALAKAENSATLQAQGMSKAMADQAAKVDLSAAAAARLFPDIEAVRAVLALTANEGENWNATADVIANKTNAANAKCIASVGYRPERTQRFRHRHGHGSAAGVQGRHRRLRHVRSWPFGHTGAGQGDGCGYWSSCSRHAALRRRRRARHHSVANVHRGDERRTCRRCRHACRDCRCDVGSWCFGCGSARRLTGIRAVREREGGSSAGHQGVRAGAAGRARGHGKRYREHRHSQLRRGERRRPFAQDGRRHRRGDEGCHRLDRGLPEGSGRDPQESPGQPYGQGG
jgi:TP901 family phage tail tape measure protein